MSWGTSIADYISVFDGYTVVDDVSYGQDFETGRIPKFPSGETTAPFQYYPLSVNVETGFPFQVHQTYPSESTFVGPLKELMGEWSAEVFWGEFWGAEFDPDGTRYSWFRVMDRKFRVVGDGEWCRGGIPIPIPSSVETVGGGRDTSIRIDPAELEGVNATISLRFNYFDMERDVTHPNYSDPVHVSTSCYRVQFTSTRGGVRRSCTAGDNGGDTLAEALAIAGITPTGVQTSATTTTRTTTTSTSTGVTFTPHSRPDETEAPQVNGKYVGAGVGAGFGLIVILYIFFKYASERKKTGGLTHHNLPRSEMRQPRPTNRRREAVGISSPAYQSGTQGGERSVVPESSLLADYRAVAEANSPVQTSGTVVRSAATDEIQPPPPIYEPPPRYEDVNAGQQRRT